MYVSYRTFHIYRVVFCIPNFFYFESNGVELPNFFESNGVIFFPQKILLNDHTKLAIPILAKFTLLSSREFFFQIKMQEMPKVTNLSTHPRTIRVTEIKYYQYYWRYNVKFLLTLLCFRYFHVALCCEPDNNGK